MKNFTLVFMVILAQCALATTAAAQQAAGKEQTEIKFSGGLMTGSEQHVPPQDIWSGTYESTTQSRIGLTQSFSFDPHLDRLQLGDVTRKDDGSVVRWSFLLNPSLHERADIRPGGRADGGVIDNLDVSVLQAGFHRHSDDGRQVWDTTILPMRLVAQNNQVLDVHKTGLEAGLINVGLKHNFDESFSGGLIFNIGSTVLGQSRILGHERIDPRTGVHANLAADFGKSGGKAQVFAGIEGSMAGTQMRYGENDVITVTNTAYAGAQYERDIGGVPMFLRYKFEDEYATKNVPDGTYTGGIYSGNLTLTNFVTVGVAPRL